MKHVFGIGFVLLAGSGLASAQYRPDQPPVLNPPAAVPQDDGAAIISAFRQKYATAKQPRIALFWNRELTDSIARATYEKSTTNSTKSASETSAGDKDNKNDE